MNSKQDDEEIRRQTKQHSLHGPTERRDQAEAPSVKGPAPKKGDDDEDDDGASPEDQRRLTELKKKRDEHRITAAELKELEALEKKMVKLEPPETKEEKKILPDMRLSMLRRARELIALYVTSRRGIGSPLGEHGEPMFAWLQEYDGMTTPTQLPADDSDLDDLPKDERDAIIKERKIERKRLADLEKKDTAVAKEDADDAEKDTKDPKKVPVF